MNKPGTFAAAAFAAALLMMSIAGTAMAASQTWYLDAEDALVADRGAFTGTADYVSVFANNHRVWSANEAALVDVDFGTGDFTWTLAFNRAYTGTFYVSIGTGSGTGFVEHARSDVQAASSALDATGAIAVTNFVVPTGERLAFQVVNLDGSGRMDVRVSDGTSYFTSTTSDPGYPTPELGTLALAGAGLGLIAVAARRRR